MDFLDICFLLVARFALLDYLGKLFYERFTEWYESRQDVSNHLEMCSVYLKRVDLIYFKSDQSTRDVVLGNNDAGTNDPSLGDLFLLDEDHF